MIIIECSLITISLTLYLLMSLLLPMDDLEANHMRVFLRDLLLADSLLCLWLPMRFTTIEQAGNRTSLSLFSQTTLNCPGRRREDNLTTYMYKRSNNLQDIQDYTNAPIITLFAIGSLF